MGVDRGRTEGGGRCWVAGPGNEMAAGSVDLLASRVEISR